MILTDNSERSHRKEELKEEEKVEMQGESQMKDSKTFWENMLSREKQ